MPLPDWFIPIFIFAVIDWVIVENLFLWLMYKEVKRLRREMKELLENLGEKCGRR
jgi:hypothetical protein